MVVCQGFSAMQRHALGTHPSEMLQSSLLLAINGSNTQVSTALALLAEGHQPPELLNKSVVIIVKARMADACSPSTALALAAGTCENMGLQVGVLCRGQQILQCLSMAAVW